MSLELSLIAFRMRDTRRDSWDVFNVSLGERSLFDDVVSLVVFGDLPGLILRLIVILI